jgi:hypothetical protein
VPLQELRVGTVGATGRHSNPFLRRRTRVELFAVAKFLAQSWADDEAILRVDAQVAAIEQGVDV